MAERAATSQRFIKSLFERSFPKGSKIIILKLDQIILDYASFFLLLLRLIKTDFSHLRAMDIEMKFAAGIEQIQMPNAKQFGSFLLIKQITKY